MTVKTECGGWQYQGNSGVCHGNQFLSEGIKKEEKMLK